MSRLASSYFVKCPHYACTWYGRLPSSPESNVEPITTSSVAIVSFWCPGCQQPFRARVIGDDVEALPIDDFGSEADAVTWPPAELGVGD